MRDYGWEIANHMWTHTRTDTLTRVQVELQVEKGKRWIENNLQSPCLVFVYPCGVTTDVDGKSITDIVASYHPYARTTTGGLWDYTPDPEILCRLARNDQVANFDAWLDDAIAAEKCLILVIHKVDSAAGDITEDNLRSLLDKIEAKGLEVVTFRDIAGRYTLPFARWKGMPDLEKSYSGTKTLSGDGVTTDFLIGEHGLGTTDRTKIAVVVTPASTDAINASPCFAYASDEDGDGAYESIRVKFSTAPAIGTDNVVIVWKAFDIS